MIAILCSSPEHPVMPYLQEFVKRSTAEVEIVATMSELRGGKILFLVSCSEVITAETRAAFEHCLVIHASDLPDGRGWSPHIWQIIEGADTVTLSLLEAAEKVDTGRIWKKLNVPIDKLALCDEINHSLFKAEVELIEYAIAYADVIVPEEQCAQPASDLRYYRKREPVDSELDINQSIKSQFNKLRVADNRRFPSFFVIDGQKFYVKIEKSE